MSESKASKPIPITVFTGFLGSGKTTLISSILSSLPETYNCVILKNEFGDVKTDSSLLSSYKVTEMTNGCLCCVLVGQMKTALLDIKKEYNPDRIIVETSGSAFPAPISIQIRQLEADFMLDSIITVIDCVNFTGYEDKSYTAKYTDLIILNKCQLVDDNQIDLVVDRVNDLNTDTARIFYRPNDTIPHSLLFGLDTRLFSDSVGLDAPHDHREVDLIQVQTETSVDMAEFTLFLNKPHQDVYRIKGFIVFTDNSSAILNWAFKRFTLTPCENDGRGTRIVFMGNLDATHMHGCREMFPNAKVEFMKR